eukprot:COSAG06_NODE_1155_length_10484_cov_7.061759_9_plen_1028_part_00
MATYVKKLDLSNRPGLRFQLGPAVGRLENLEILGLSNTGLFGTFPHELGQLSSLETLFLGSNPSLSGTIPSELGGLTKLQTLYLHSNPSLTGTIPRELREMTALQTLHLYNNPSLTGTIPSELGELTNLGTLYLYSSPSLSGTIPRELGELTNLQKLYLYSSPSLSGTIPRELGGLPILTALDTHSNIGLSGSLPTLPNYTKFDLLNVNNCSLTSLPSSLPRSISHLYLNRNPILATMSGVSTLLGSLDGSRLHVLDAGFSWPLQLDGFRDGAGKGTRVANPRSCHIGTACEFILFMYDKDDQPATVGGLLSGLTLRLNSTESLMRDNRDGTFTASIPAEWIQRSGTYLFEFFDGKGEEFKPRYTAENVFVDSVPNIINSLRTVDFLPRQCPNGSHTVADEATGATCVCKQPGFDVTADNSSELRCHRQCHADESVSDDRGSCLCVGRNYDTDLHGVLLCSTNGLVGSDSLDSSHTYKQAKQTRSEGGRCVPCPNECTRCDGGVVTVLEGWRLNSTTPEELRSQVVAGRQGRPQWLFSCPYDKADCPEISLSAVNGENDTLALCPSHHDGPLCATCEAGYSRRGSSDNKCEACSDMLGYIDAQFGLPAAYFVVLVLAIVFGFGGVAYTLRAQLQVLKAETKTNLRILLGSAQVLSLLPSVLELVFPEDPKAALSFAAIFVADLRAILRTECWGWSWYDRWAASVFGMPLVAVVPVAVYWLWSRISARHVDSDSRETLHIEARESSLRALAFVAMLLYPQFSSQIFSALRCETLGETSSWLEVDYTVSCMDERYARYRTAALVMAFVVPVGFPLALLAALLRSWRQSSKLWEEAQRQTAMEAASAAEYHYARVQELFGFCIEDYRSGCFWFEPVDMLRKLALSGLLQFVHRGTAAQCFFGSAVAFLSFGLQQWLRPYRDLESNILKAIVDAQLFMTFLISFILRVLPDINSSEPFDTEVYGWLLLCSMVTLLCCAVGLTVVQVRRRYRFKARLLQLGDGTSSSSANLSDFSAVGNVQEEDASMGRGAE